MEPEKVIVPCKRSLDVESEKRNKTIRFTLNGVPTQESCKKTSGAMICSKGMKHMENIGASNKNGPSLSENGLSDQNIELGPSKQLIGLDKSNSNQMKQEEKKLATATNNASENNGNQDDDASPEALLTKLQKEVHKLSHKLNKYSKKCVKLQDENEILLSELKEACEPHVFEELQRKNPNLLS